MIDRARALRLQLSQSVLLLAIARMWLICYRMLPKQAQSRKRRRAAPSRKPTSLTPGSHIMRARHSDSCAFPLILLKCIDLHRRNGLGAWVVVGNIAWSRSFARHALEAAERHDIALAMKEDTGGTCRSVPEYGGVGVVAVAEALQC